jgi:hypothetical protein
MKKNLLFLSILFLMAVVPAGKVLAVADTTLSFSPSTITKIVGNTFSVNIDINTGTNSVQAMDLAFTFNKSTVQVTGISMGGLMTNFTEIVKTIDNTNGKVTYSLGAKPGTSAVVKGSGTVAVVSFKALSAGSSTQAFVTSSVVIAAQGETGNVFKSAAAGTITVEASSGGSADTGTTDTNGGIGGGEMPVSGVDDWKHLITVALGFIGIGALLLLL